MVSFLLRCISSQPRYLRRRNQSYHAHQPACTLLKSPEPFLPLHHILKYLREDGIYLIHHRRYARIFYVACQAKVLTHPLHRVFFYEQASTHLLHPEGPFPQLRSLHNQYRIFPFRHLYLFELISNLPSCLSFWPPPIYQDF